MSAPTPGTRRNRPPILGNRASALVLLLAASSPCLLALETGMVTGRTVGPDREPSGVAEISLRLASSVTGQVRRTISSAQGAFEFTDLEPGVYLLTVDSPEYEPSSSRVEVTPGQETALDVNLIPLFEATITVTATRTPRRTEEVPASVTVIGEDRIRQAPMTNLRDALVGTPGTLIESRNQGYDSRLVIRGAGLKARYAIREIMVLLDGIPVTDPDSLTRLDFIDTHLVERIEVVRGPSSTLWGINATGGAVNVITRSPFDGGGGTARLGVGSHGARSYQFGYTGDLPGGHVYDLNVSRRESDNSWRRRNVFDTTQITFRPCFTLTGDTLWESSFSYTEANLQLPGRLIADPGLGIDQWSPYVASGRVETTAEPWRHSGRYSKIFGLRSRLVKQAGFFEIKPQLYLNSWEHVHPVTGRINDAKTLDGGLDVQVDLEHGLGTLTGGVTLRFGKQDSEAFTYAETSTSPDGRILATGSDRTGERMRRLHRDTLLGGIYLQEALRLGDRWLVDLGVRLDRIQFDISGFEWIDFDYTSARYVAGEGRLSSERAYSAVNPSVGVVRRLQRGLHVYGSLSTGTQTPTSDELTINPHLNLTRVVSYEVGLKGRRRVLTFDAAAYLSPVEDEVVQTIEANGETVYVNAGKTEKRGAEIAVTSNPWAGLSVGGAYSYSHYVFSDFSEPVRGRMVDRSGNRLPFVPTHQYSLHLQYVHSSGLRVRASANTWGDYYVDNANSEKYDGYRLLTDLTIGYEGRRHELALLVQNLFDQRYAVEAQKDLYGTTRYAPAAPRSLSARLIYRFP